MLAQGIVQTGIEVQPETQQKLLAYLALLQKWNKVYNLTALRKPEQMVSHHILDSIVVLPHLWPGKWLDVGCGAGLPGLVLALMRPDWQLTLIDSNSKKTSFVKQAVIELGLKNVQVSCARIEAWYPDNKFDGIISRAFAELAEFTTLSRHVLKPSGKWVAMKGQPEQELGRIAVDTQVERVIPLFVPNMNAARCLVVVKMT